MVLPIIHLLKEKGYLENSRIQYTFAGKYGGAGGFYEGVKRAYEAGYDWLLMDDDGTSTRCFGKVK